MAPSLPLFITTSGRRSPGWASGARKKYPGNVVSSYGICTRSAGTGSRSTARSHAARDLVQSSPWRSGALEWVIRYRPVA